MPSDVSASIPNASFSHDCRPSADGTAEDGGSELSIGTAALRFVAMLLVTLASAVAISGFEPTVLATVVGGL